MSPGAASSLPDSAGNWRDVAAGLGPHEMAVVKDPKDFSQEGLAACSYAYSAMPASAYLADKASRGNVARIAGPAPDSETDRRMTVIYTSALKHLCPRAQG